MAIYSVVKPLGQKFLKPVMNIFARSDPNLLTWFGVVFSLLAGVCLLGSRNRSLLLAAIPFILLRMAFNVIDGMVARQTGKTSAYGEALAEFSDRISDAGMLLGLAFSPYCTVMFGLLGIIVVLISSYVGILGKAVGAQRQFGGIMGKVDRLILIMVFCIAQYIMAGRNIVILDGFRNFDLLMVVFILGGIITAVQRWRMIERQLAQPGK